MRECDHARGRDPRFQGSCVKCGRVLPRVLERDPEYEQRFLEQVVAHASRAHGVDASSYVRAVQARLAIGAERYGDNDFATKDVISELLEETPDVAAYALLELQKDLHTGVESDRAHALFQAAVHAAVADHYARRARS